MFNPAISPSQSHSSRESLPEEDSSTNSQASKGTSTKTQASSKRKPSETSTSTSHTSTSSFKSKEYARVGLPNGLKAEKPGKHHGRRLQYLTTAVEWTSDTSLVSGISKVIKSAGNIVKETGSESATLIGKNFSFFGDFFKMLGIFKGAKTIAECISKRRVRGLDRLKDAKTLKRMRVTNTIQALSGLLQMKIAAMTFVKILDLFKLIKITDITNGIGRIPVVGPSLAIIAPFTAVANFFEIARNIVDITLASRRIQDQAKKISGIRKKSSAFKNDGNITKHLDSHTQKISVKIHRAESVLADMENSVEKTGEKVKKAADKYTSKKKACQDTNDSLKGSPRIKKFFKEEAAKRDVEKAKKHLLKTKRRHDKVCDERDLIKEAKAEKQIKLEVYEKMAEIYQKNSDLNAPSNKPLVDTMTMKQLKWKAQKSHSRSLQKRDAIDIIIKTFTIAVLITCTALMFAGVTSPIAMMTTSSAYLLIGVTLVLFDIYKKKNKLVDPKSKPEYAVNFSALKTSFAAA